MGLQGLRHLRARQEQPREDALVGLDHRIALVPHVELEGAVVGVQHHLHAVADVVERLFVGLRVRVAVAHGVGVLYPEELAVGRHQVRVVVEEQERGDGGYPLLDLPAVLNAAVRRDFPGDQDVDVRQLPGVGDPPDQRSDGHPAPTVVPDAAQLACLCLEVELLRIGVHYDVVRRLFAVVDARVGDYVSGVVVGAFLLHLYDPRPAVCPWRRTGVAPPG